MENHLKNNILVLLEKFPGFKVSNFRDRVIIYSKTSNNHDQIAQLIANSISGVSSVSSALIVTATEKNIISGGLTEVLMNRHPFRTFAVRVRREGNHSFSSMDIARKLGSEILSSQKKDLKVDLKFPDFQIFLDIRGPLAFIFTKSYTGIDGIPSLSQGTAVALIKPHYNSILSAWLMKKRGVKILPVFFKTGKSSEEKYINYTKHYFGTNFTIIQIESLLNSFQDNLSLCLLCQAKCEHICHLIAKKMGCTAIISPTSFKFNNESMSIRVLSYLDKNISFPVIRPIQMGYFGHKIVQEKFDNKACCSFKSEVFIDFSSNFNESTLKRFMNTDDSTT
jgi:thiamine biosynthesis protein ThiI